MDQARAAPAALRLAQSTPRSPSGPPPPARWANGCGPSPFPHLHAHPVASPVPSSYPHLALGQAGFAVAWEEHLAGDRAAFLEQIPKS